MSDTSVAGDSFTLTEAHHVRCRELSCQLGYERRGVVCHVMQDLSLPAPLSWIDIAPTQRALAVRPLATGSG